jgi:hypothetical protein
MGGIVEWLRYDAFYVSKEADSHESERERIKDWLTKRTWIEWYYTSFDQPRHVWYPKGEWNPYYAPRENFQLPRGWKRTGCFMKAIQPRHKCKPSNEGCGYRITNDENNPYGRIPEGPPRFPGLTQNVKPKLLHKKSGCLQFWTASAHFHVQARVPAEEARICYDVLDRNNELCGFVYLHAPQQTNSSNEQEFIMLSECKYDGANMPAGVEEYDRKRESKGDDWVSFNAMMIVWHDGVAERAGLGRIMKKALQKAYKSPVWKEILLA